MNEEELFHAALAKPAEQRSAFLDQACSGNASLRAAVESLLAAHEAMGSFLNTAPLGANPLQADVDATLDSAVPPNAGLPASPEHAVTIEHPSDAGSAKAARSQQNATTNYLRDASAGAVIGGRYTLQEKIGEGGMGEVWVAKQTEPVKRKVALKLIKTGMDSRAVLQRFEQERQALALMDHPNIARVLDGGMTPTGQPFFVMELVNGLPLTKFCDELKLTLKQRLELFVPICQAVQHAHQKGIVHRDLKPANILVTMIDARPVPKVIDFGVAKATSGKLTEETMSTGFGAVVGTLEYMSPEQAGFSGEDIDTRADIYSLGVILYEVLTGLRPIDAKRLRKAALTEMIRIIREEEPSKPSTRLSTDESLPSLAAVRQIEPKKLTALLRGELDWVVMKCLEKQRDRRYETANALARDVQRYLADEAVEARPPSTGYRLQKFVQRNKGQVIAAGLVLLALIGGMIGTSYGMYRAKQAADAERLAKIRAEDAAEEERLAKLDAEAKRMEAEKQKTRAEEREQQAIDAVKRFGDAVARNEALKNNPTLESLRKTLLKEPLSFFKTLREQLQADNDTRPETLARLAQAAIDLGSLTKAIGDKGDALRVHQEALAIRERLARENPTIARFQRELSHIHNDIGNLQAETGQSAEALVSYTRAKKIQEQLLLENPTDTEYQRALATFHANIGMLQTATGQTAEALASFTLAREMQERLVSQNPTMAQHQNDLATCYLNFGNLQSDIGELNEAVVSFKQARDIFLRLVQEDPTDTKLKYKLAASHNNVGLLHFGSGHAEEALASYTQARDVQMQLTKENPTVTAFQMDLATSHNNIGNVLASVGRSDEALASYAQSMEIREWLVRENPTDIDFQFSLAVGHRNIGGLQRNLGRLIEALSSYKQALDIFERLAAQNPTVTEFEGGLAGSLSGIGIVHVDMGRPDEALASFVKALEIHARLAREHPESPELASQLGLLLSNIAVVDSNADRFAEARERLLQAVEWQRKALTANPESPYYRKLMTDHLEQIIKIAQNLNDAEGADDARRQLAELHASDPEFQAIDARLTAIANGETAKDNAERLQLGLLAYKTQRYALSARLIREALESDPQLQDDRQAQHRYNAACAASLAGAGMNNPSLDDSAKVELRAQARAWLAAELIEWSKLLESAKTPNPHPIGTPAPETIRAILEHWTKDPDLASIRDASELARLPSDEQEACNQLWAKVVELLKEPSNEKP